ncbi:MAG TPA: hypothetical protein PLL30_00425 [Candidatus Krumholzibacteria bacterium]|nr:hypothetical protein [Candidatus Krumholzibacteria bacterium]HPD70224.1 hypothetical protein [Candidatus Krumholzibacteria bacterium]HRY40076.1 hypothetical protein [Candidatus Krumholzibacteria bacterium]
MPPTADPAAVLCGDIKQGLRIQSDLLAGVEATLRERLGALEAIPVLRRPDSPVLVPGIPPIVQDKGCRIVAPVPTLDETLDLDRALALLRILLQLPWSVLSGLPDDQALTVPPVVEPLGIAAAAPADEATG